MYLSRYTIIDIQDFFQLQTQCHICVNTYKDEQWFTIVSDSTFWCKCKQLIYIIDAMIQRLIKIC